MQKILTLSAICIWQIFKFLPLKLLMLVGYGLGKLIYLIPSKRKKIVLQNLELCFPYKSILERSNIANHCFQEVIRSILERSIVWFGSKKQVLNLVNIHGLENLPNDGAILLGIHMVGLEAGGIALACKLGGDKFITIYMPQKNKIFDTIVKKQRMRFGSVALEKHNSAKPTLKHLRQGKYIQIFADMDFGIKDSIFSNFFGNPASTITSIPKLSKLSGKKVVPMVPIFNSKTAKYDLYILPAFDNYPTENLQHDIDRLNHHFEEVIIQKIEQYWWVHRRFKTKPTTI